MRAFLRFRFLLAILAMSGGSGCQDDEVAIGEPGMQGVILRDKKQAQEVADHREAIQKEGEGVAYGD